MSRNFCFTTPQVLPVYTEVQEPREEDRDWCWLEGARLQSTAPPPRSLLLEPASGNRGFQKARVPSPQSHSHAHFNPTSSKP